MVEACWMNDGSWQVCNWNNNSNNNNYYYYHHHHYYYYFDNNNDNDNNNVIIINDNDDDDKDFLKVYAHVRDQSWRDSSTTSNKRPPNFVISIFLLQKVRQDSTVFCQPLPSNSVIHERLKHFSKDPRHAKKPQKHKLTTVLLSDLLSPCNARILQQYFCFSRFCEFHSERNPSIVLC